MHRILLAAMIAFATIQGQSQPLSGEKGFTRQDTLRGSLRPERLWWDVQKYTISIEPDYLTKTTRGRVDILFSITPKNPARTMQLDLQEPLKIDSVLLNGVLVTQWNREGNVYFIDLKKGKFLSAKSSGTTARQMLRVYYSGKPVEARRPPWEGGWIWSKDKQGRPWMSVACQGLGASVWYPCKDHQSDEPDLGAELQVIVPDTLVAVGNGHLLKEEKISGNKKVYTWAVKNPINNYNIIPYIGKYVHFAESYAGEKGKLACDYWVLDYDLEKAKSQFGRDVKRMLQAFEHWFGPYPFYEDGFKLVESPHLGMEHQSAVAYGNEFKNGYRGNDLSRSGWGLKFDFIIIHEAGHEWFGNNITTKDIADMWVHEGFTNYSETLFTDYHYGKEAGNAYVQGTRASIQNDIPITGPYGVNREGSGDMYYKAGNLIHMIRQVVNDDEKFRKMLRGLNQKFYHQTVIAKQVEEYISKEAGFPFESVFNQYLKTTQVPVLEYKISDGKLSYRWTNCVEGFNLPLKLAGSDTWIKPTTTWNEIKAPDMEFGIDKNFYIKTKPV